MTSKEALKSLILENDIYLKNSINTGYDIELQKYYLECLEYKKELLEIIERDLEVLEIIKKNACNVLNIAITFKNTLPSKQYEILKEWFKNDK